MCTAGNAVQCVLLGMLCSVFCLECCAVCSAGNAVQFVLLGMLCSVFCWECCEEGTF